MTALPKLFCFPPAGAGPSLFYPWTQRYGNRLDISPVPLPGRETRIAEPLPRTIDELADRLAKDLRPLPRRYALFGYSMGAILAYEVGRRWAQQRLSAPEMIFILACNPPDRLLDGREPLHTMEDSAFWEAIMDIGGTPKEILELAEARKLFEPILRNDFRICETYELRPDGTRLGCPAHVFVAEEDNMVDAEAAVGWQDYVSSDFTLYSLSGKHMLEKRALDTLLDKMVLLWLGGA